MNFKINKKNRYNFKFESLFWTIIILTNIVFLILGIFSSNFRKSLPYTDNSPSCRYEQNCD